MISKGRWEHRRTSRSLEEMNQPYRIVVEPSEAEQYMAVIDPSKVLVLPEDFSSTKQSGSIPARNWVWEHAFNEGHDRHWILDDNIEQFNRLNRNLQVKVTSRAIWAAAEDFVDRYSNVALAGFQYDYFAKAKTVLPPFYLNTRIYSCILIKNSLPYRWRGKYNEDTDLSLRVLKDGWCTILFHAFIQQKTQTMKAKGGNTDTIYNTGDNRLEFAQSLVDQHPDLVKVTQKFGRWHHHVNYKPFKENKLIRTADVSNLPPVDNYGMVLRRKDGQPITDEGNEFCADVSAGAADSGRQGSGRHLSGLGPAA